LRDREVDVPAPREEVAMDPLVPVIVVMLGPEIV
jgi:hypothetical protein